MVDKAKLYALQQVIRRAQRGADSARGELKAQHAKAAACTSPGFWQVIECFREDQPSACDDVPAWRVFRELVTWPD